MILLNLYKEKTSNLSVCRLIIVALFSVLMFAVLTHAATESSILVVQDEEIGNPCGPRALWKAISLLGHYVEISQCIELAGTDPNGFTSLAGLENAAKALVYPAKGMNLTPRELAFVGGPAILHVTMPDLTDHFVTFKSINEDLFELIDFVDSGEQIKFVTADQLRLMWNGNCLVFAKNLFLTTLKVGIYKARFHIAIIIAAVLGIFTAILIFSFMLKHSRFILDPLISSVRISFFVISGLIIIFAMVMIFMFLHFTGNGQSWKKYPRLIIGATVYDTGDLELGQSFISSIWIGNGGTEKLVIDTEKIKTSCSCLKYAVPKHELTKSDKSELKFKLSPSKIGPFEFSMYIPSNDPQGGQVFKVKGQVRGAGGLAYPPRLYFGRINNIENTNKKIFYILRRPNISILRVSCNLPFVKCTFIKKDSESFEIDISLTKIPELEQFDGTIYIETNDPETEHATIEVPVSGIVIQVTENEL
ncbi:DUF1573 domain-containing protein [Planctomycetota bacterium]